MHALTTRTVQVPPPLERERERRELLQALLGLTGRVSPRPAHLRPRWWWQRSGIGRHGAVTLKAMRRAYMS